MAKFDNDRPFDDSEDWTAEATVKTEAGYMVRRFTLTAVEGPATGLAWESTSDRCAIGSHARNDLVIDDPTVSRFHCEVRLDDSGPRVRDVQSRNGTRVDGLKIADAWLRSGSAIRIGRTVLRFDLARERNRLPISERQTFGSMVGASVKMRTVFATLERAAATHVTVLLEGETGTGKGEAAAAIHEVSPRKDGPLVVVDCGAIPPNLIESELFGHERGSFTGADRQRIGAFEAADGGTVFLDEIGELPLEMQPAMLRVLENGELRRVGSTQTRTVDVRVVAATNRDLRAEVSAGRFREDLYYRLAVVRVQMPPLRSRPDDIPLLVPRLLHSMGVERARAPHVFKPEFIAQLQRAAWPGNVRELRNYLERCIVFEEPQPLAQETEARALEAVDASIPYEEARRQMLERFERSYTDALLKLHQGNVSKAARAAGMGRTYLHRLLARHGVKAGHG